MALTNIPKIVLREYLRRNPPHFRLHQYGWLSQYQWIAPVVDEIKTELDPLTLEEPTTPSDLTEVPPPQFTPQVQGVDHLYRQYRCKYSEALSCTLPLQTVQQDPTAKYCSECSFPATLAEKSEIRGRRGRYRIEGLLGRRGMGRLYKGIQVADQQPVVIKEYLLPDRCFNEEETRLRQQTFELAAGLSLADGRVQDVRLRHPWDAISDPIAERCYLVTTSNLDTHPTLNACLAANGAMTSRQVRQVLNQVLQTLEFLHGQKFSLPSGQVQQGIAHGNISLDSLLMVTDDQKFFIHVCDLALWERLFDLPTAQTVIPTVTQDLIALGYVAFYLLVGRSTDPVSGQLLDPKDEQQWPVVEPHLKMFIFRLLGLDVSFESAEEARQALLKLPPEKPVDLVVVDTVPLEEQKTKLRRLPWLLLGALGVTLLGILIWFLIPKSQAGNRAADDDFLVCCIKEIPGIPAGKFTYTAEKDGTWSYILRHANLISKNKTLEDKLRERQPKLELNYQAEPSGEEAIAKVSSQQVDFAISSLVSDLTSELKYKPVAYDGLVVFVAFSYAKREKSLPQSLKGQITFEQLRQLYTGEITNWQVLGGPDLPVKLYIPKETEAVRIFEQRVLKDEQKIALFRKLIQKSEQPPPLFKNSFEPEIKPLSTFETLRQVIRDFEDDEVGGIAFGTISKVFGQCSAYPLALKDGNKPAIQALIQDNGKPVEPTTDLCDDKGSYHPNIEFFKNSTYPLAYPITVIYSGDNRRIPAGQKFAELLRTLEAQRLLSKAGLVPLQPLE
ncbi:substrate-binding domain-containing protein [Coleofasciculus sp. FACHB-SPT9]|uniref:substrate-binding domain-containing protein n=1 Tax=Cyanophyceae TaxID=3028117 RepID=UPI0016865870|nr:substrate-binding domain-containing protein [Coleofasciculus sp. FACHB-SPT9]